jgi:hypothetical protein
MDNNLLPTYVSTERSSPVVSSPPATEVTGAIGREIESRRGIGV